MSFTMIDLLLLGLRQSRKESPEDIETEHCMCRLVCWRAKGSGTYSVRLKPTLGSTRLATVRVVKPKDWVKSSRNRMTKDRRARSHVVSRFHGCADRFHRLQSRSKVVGAMTSRPSLFKSGPAAWHQSSNSGLQSFLLSSRYVFPLFHPQFSPCYDDVGLSPTNQRGCCCPCWRREVTIACCQSQSILIPLLKVAQRSAADKG